MTVQDIVAKIAVVLLLCYIKTSGMWSSCWNNFSTYYNTFSLLQTSNTTHTHTSQGEICHQTSSGLDFLLLMINQPMRVYLNQETVLGICPNIAINQDHHRTSYLDIHTGKTSHTGRHSHCANSNVIYISKLPC